MKISFLSIVFLLSLISCVSKKKYASLQEQNQSLTEEKNNLEEVLNKLAIENDSLKEENLLLDSLLKMEKEKIVSNGNKKANTKSKGKKSNLSKQEETELKSVFIYNFTSYISWNKFNADKYIIGVAGNQSMVDMLSQQTKGKTFAKAPIIVQSYKTGEIYQMIYISASKSGEFNKIKKENAGKSTLLITDNPLLNNIGGHIAFYIDGSKVNFQVNKAGIEKAGMHVSSKLINFSEN